MLFTTEVTSVRLSKITEVKVRSESDSRRTLVCVCEGACACVNLRMLGCNRACAHETDPDKLLQACAEAAVRTMIWTDACTCVRCVLLCLGVCGCAHQKDRGNEGVARVRGSKERRERV